MLTTEYDGAPLLNDPVTFGEPRLDLSALGAYRGEIIAYAHCFTRDGAEAAEFTGAKQLPNSVGTWTVIQRAATSGVVMNGASTNWCSSTGVDGTDGMLVRKIILNMIDVLMTNQSVFST